MILEAYRAYARKHNYEYVDPVLDDYGLSKEEFWKDPKAFIDKLEDKDAKLTLEIFMEVL